MSDESVGWGHCPVRSVLRRSVGWGHCPVRLVLLHSVGWGHCPVRLVLRRSVGWGWAAQHPDSDGLGVYPVFVPHLARGGCSNFKSQIANFKSKKGQFAREDFFNHERHETHEQTEWMEVCCNIGAHETVPRMETSATQGHAERAEVYFSVINFSVHFDHSGLIEKEAAGFMTEKLMTEKWEPSCDLPFAICHSLFEIWRIGRRNLRNKSRTNWRDLKTCILRRPSPCYGHFRPTA